jgi:hypothetical protein
LIREITAWPRVKVFMSSLPAAAVTDVHRDIILRIGHHLFSSNISNAEYVY